MLTSIYNTDTAEFTVIPMAFFYPIEATFISFQGNKYSVPYQYARKRAILKISADSFDVFCDNQKICTHKIAHGTNRSIILKEHSKGLLKETMDRNRQKNPAPEVYELKFKDFSVEERSLDTYDIFALDGNNQ